MPGHDPHSDPAARPDAEAPMARSVTIPREADVAPIRPTPWRDAAVSFDLPPEAPGSAAGVLDLLDEPELHFSPGLRRGHLALLPSPLALTRVVLSWEWSVAAADFAVHSFEPMPFDDEQRGRLERWLRSSAARLVAAQADIDAAAGRAARGIARGEALGPLVVRLGAWPQHRVDVVIGTALASTVDPTTRVVDVRLPDPAEPDWEVFVDTAGGDPLGYRETLHREGDAYAFRYLVADHVDDVAPRDLVHWHDQHIQRQMLEEDVRQVLVHLLSGLEAPASVRYPR